MSIIPKGGRGQKAPYTTTHARIPEAIKPLVEEITIRYKELYLVAGEQEANNFLLQIRERLFIEPKHTMNSLTFSDEELRQIAEEILHQKKSARISLVRFIQRTFNRYFTGL